VVRLSAGLYNRPRNRPDPTAIRLDPTQFVSARIGSLPKKRGYYRRRASGSHNQSAVEHGRRQQIFEAFADADKPVLTTAEIHKAVGGVTLETIRSDLKQMRGSELGGRGTTQDYVWWVDKGAVGGDEEEGGVATGDEIRRAVVSLIVDRLDVRILAVALLALTLNSLLGVGIYLMLELDMWLLPISELEAIVYTYVPMVVLGMVIAASAAIVVGRERL